MFKNKLGEDSAIPKLIHLKIRRRDGVESLTTLEAGECNISIDGCINKGTNSRQNTYEISHVYSIFYSGFMCQTTAIFGITKDGSLY